MKLSERMSSYETGMSGGVVNIIAKEVEKLEAQLEAADRLDLTGRVLAAMEPGTEGWQKAAGYHLKALDNYRKAKGTE